MSTVRSLPWLERLNAYLPDYSGYQQQSDRRRADEAIREAIATRLLRASENLTLAIQQCKAHQAERHVGPIQAIQGDILRLVDRIQQSGSPHVFEQAAEFDEARADTFHALDHALLAHTDQIHKQTHQPAVDHDWLARLKDDLELFERELNARALLFRELP